MKVAIVGAGPSMIRYQRGKAIDRFDYVVRLKRCGASLALPAYYGSKVNAVGGSLGIAMDLLDIGNRETEIWLFSDTRRVEDRVIDQIQKALAMRNRPFKFNRELCDALDARYRYLRKPFTPDARMTVHDALDETIDDTGRTLGHRHTSQGMKAIAYATSLLNPTEIVLFGFDNMASGEFEFSLTRGISHTRYPMHNWQAERDLLSELMKEHPITFAKNESSY